MDGTSGFTAPPDERILLASLARPRNTIEAGISSGTPSSQFSYGPDRQRFKQVGNYTGGTETTYSIGGVLEKVIGVSVTHYRHLIASPSGPVANYTRRDNATEDTYYFTRDHLGSIDTVTNASASIQVRLSYDAFGLRRNEAGWNGAVPSGDLTAIAGTTRHGYTEHEHLDNLSLIHMNGRVQDPTLGRFLSADPYVPHPTLGQSFNRYSYVRNNPLSWTDPSGFKEESHFRIQNNDQLAGWGDSTGLQFGEAGSNGNFGGMSFSDYFFATHSTIGVVGTGETVGVPQSLTSVDGDSLPQPTPDSRETSSVPCDKQPCNLQSTMDGPCLVGCHSGGIVAPVVTPELRAATTRFYQNLAEDFIPGAGLYQLSTGEYFLSGDEGSRVLGALASAPYLGFALKQVASGIRITSKGLGRIESHLDSLGALDDPANQAMLQRLRDGLTTQYDINFYLHELKESALMRRGADYNAAHQGALRWQGIPYNAATPGSLYHPDVIRHLSEWFNSAAWPK